jgi:HNH endonuclease
MNRTISKHIRKLVAVRAGFRCEYCRVLEYLSHYAFHTEHIIGFQHGGTHHPNNLAYSCAWCNWKKGPNLATILQPDNKLVPLFNPRTQNWFDHFEVSSTDGKLIAKSPEAQATIKLLELNHPERQEERLEVIKHGFYP